MLKRKHNNNQRRTLAALGSCGQSWELTVGYEEDDYRVMVGHKSEVFFRTNSLTLGKLEF